MTRETVDILVVGGGIAGLVATAAFARAGFATVMVDPAPPLPVDAAQSDQRSTAFLRPARDLFRHIGIWDQIAPHATPLDALRIIDLAGNPPELRGERLFRGAEMGDEPFGWNFLNRIILHDLIAVLADIPQADLRYGTGFRAITTRTDGAIVTLGDGTQIAARLVIGADGRNSPLREAVGIGVKTTRYGQKSLAFQVTHDLAHENTSSEIYHEGGPFTMVPMPDIDGSPASAIVWMNRGPRANALLQMDATAFNAEMLTRTAGLFGNLRLISPRAIWPIITQRADRLAAERVALIAEAAHVLPPIGAQGLNTSLNDIAELLRLAEARPGALGSMAMLDAYARKRMPDITARLRAIDVFNRITRGENPALQSLRLAGLRVIHDVTPLRRGVMRAGMQPI